MIRGDDEDDLSLRDRQQARNGELLISDCSRTCNGVEFLNIWETVHNPASNYGEFATIKSVPTKPSVLLLFTGPSKTRYNKPEVYAFYTDDV